MWFLNVVLKWVSFVVTFLSWLGATIFPMWNCIKWYNLIFGSFQGKSCDIPELSAMFIIITTRHNFGNLKQMRDIFTVTKLCKYLTRYAHLNQLHFKATIVSHILHKATIVAFTTDPVKTAFIARFFIRTRNSRAYTNQKTCKDIGN